MSSTRRVTSESLAAIYHIFRREAPGYDSDYGERWNLITIIKNLVDIRSIISNYSGAS